MKKLALLLFALSSTASAQQYATSFKSTEISPGIHMLDGADGFGGGNVVLLVGDEYIVLIDDAMAPTVPQLMVEARELAGRPVDFVINTHAHGDHVGGNNHMAEHGAIIVAHDNVRARMIPDPQLNIGPGALPVITFSDTATFHINGIDALVFHIEDAHTDGDAVVFFPEANVIAGGDIVFRGLFPFIDIDNGGSVSGFAGGLRRLIEMSNDQTRIIAGHGPVASKKDLQTDLAMLLDAEVRVRALIEKGMSDDEVLAENPLAHYDDAYSWNFITTEVMTRTLIRSINSGE